MKPKHCYRVLLVFFWAVSSGYSQIYNQEIEAKIVTEETEEWIEITATAYNISTVTQSIRYELSVIRNTLGSSNFSKNAQSGRKVLEPAVRSNLSTTSINVNPEDRVVILLLIYDDNDNLIGKDRIAYNDANSSDIEIKEEIVENLKNDTDNNDIGESYDGIQLRGVVIDETKTKAGRDYYQMFYSSYIANQINSEKIVTLRESFSMGNNTRIQVLIENDVVFEFFVRTQTDYLKSMAEVSIKKLGMHFNRLKREAGLIKRY